MPFTERTPLETGFATPYTGTVQPQLAELEFEREALLKRSKQRNLMIAGAVVVACVVTYFLTYDLQTFLVLTAVFAACGWFGSMFLQDGATLSWSSKIRDIALPAMCDHIGNLRFSAKGGGFSISIFKHLGLLPSHDKVSHSSTLTGTHNDLQFEVARTVLTERRSDGTDDSNNIVQTFKGLLFTIALPEGVTAPGSMALRRDHGRLGNGVAKVFGAFGARGMETVSFPEDEPFEAAFEVFCDTPDVARTFLSDDMRRALCAIRGHGTSLTAGVDNGSLVFALEKPTDFLLMGGIDTSTADIEEDLHRAFADIALVLEIVDTVAEALPRDGN